MPAIRSNIWKMYSYNFLLSLFFISAVLVPFFSEWGGLSFFQIMILQSWFVLWTMVLEIPTGALGDFLGRKPTLVIAAAINALGVAVYASFPSFYLFLLGEFLWAISVAMMSGTNESMVYDTLKAMKKGKSSKKILGRFHSFEVIGLMVAAPIGSIIAASLGVRWTMLLMTVPFIMAMLIGLTLREPPVRKPREGIRYLETLTEGVRYFYSHKILRILAFDGIIISMLVFFIVWLYQPRLQQINLSIAYFGIVASVMTALQALIMNNFGSIEKFVRSKKTFMMLSALIPGVGFILLGMTSDIIFSVILIIIVAGVGMPRYVLFSNYMNKYIKSSNRATVLSTISMIRDFGMAISYPLVGLLVQWSLAGAFIVIGALLLVFALVSRVREEHLVD